MGSTPLAAGPAISIQDLAVLAEVIEDGLTLFWGHPMGRVVRFRYSILCTSPCISLSSPRLLSL